MPQSSPDPLNMPSQQKALLLEQKQGEWVVGVRDVPIPAAGELLVEIHATALNPVDWLIQKYGFIITDYPAVLGGDAAGIVAAVGDGVGNFVEGDRVFVPKQSFMSWIHALIVYYRLFEGYFANPKGTFQQYAVVPAEITAKVSHLHLDSIVIPNTYVMRPSCRPKFPSKRRHQYLCVFVRRHWVYTAKSWNVVAQI